MLRRAEVAGEGDALDQPVGERELAPDVDHVPGIPAVAAEGQIADREVDLRAERARDLGREEVGRPAVHRQRVVAQDPGVVLEEAERAEPGRRDVAMRIDQHEEPVVLEHQGVLGETLVGALDPGVADGLLHRDGSEALGRVVRRTGSDGRRDGAAHAAVIGRGLPPPASGALAQ